MRVSAIVSALASVAVATPLVARDANSIVAAVNNIESNIATLNATVNTLKAGSAANLPIVLKIQQQDATLNTAVDNATTVAANSAKLTNSGSNTVAGAVLNLQPQISSLLQNLVNHKPIFDSAFLGAGSVSPQVKKDLQAQQNSSLAFGRALIPKLSGVYASIAPSIVSQINDTFTQAIAAFNNSGSGVPVPPFFPTGAN